MEAFRPLAVGCPPPFFHLATECCKLCSESRYVEGVEGDGVGDDVHCVYAIMCVQMCEGWCVCVCTDV